MSIIWSEQIDPILSQGKSLNHLGVRNWALGHDEALLAIHELEALGIAILGGDVYKLVSDKFEHTYDSWHCDQEVDECDSIFLKRSSDKARSYILNYPTDEGLFILVPKI
ncbi:MULTISPECIES: Imm40 family immunity protein [Pseudomonas syringae group]|uniref:Immunity protein 40 domain-containing protein n=1 Tax=Pseudomonas syringae pv. coriandricola TaxID=264453 RepID=A0A0P9LGU2_9PSED|nr:MULTISPECIES: Imm40 family immunity protein [Pseudomonas syringae group]KPW73761.1 Uncharacterized protein ALO76_02669 [Pseudomonas syringae pv. coriandricola]RMN07714.1 hypothetical protein ALQ65_200286 [Pseudomonas syringae pv. coriandricola]